MPANPKNFNVQNDNGSNENEENVLEAEVPYIGPSLYLPLQGDI